MKKILSIILISAAAFCASSCVQEEELLFEKSAAERLNEASTLYTQRLLAAPHGWVFEYYPQASISKDKPLKGAGYLMVVKFNKDRSVTVGMKNTLSGNRYIEDTSAWEVITDNGPVLSFNTYNKCIHTFSDPEDVPYTSDNETGKGMLGDYEFVMVDVPEEGDHIILKGKKRGTYSRLTKLDQEVDIEEYLNDCQKKLGSLFSETYRNYVTLHIGDDKVTMENMYSAMPEYYFEGEDKVLTSKVNTFIFSKTGEKYYARFKNELKNHDGEIAEKEFVYDEANSQFVGVENSDVKITAPEYNEFFYSQTLCSSPITWRLAKNSDMSESFVQLWNNATAALAKSSYTLTESNLSTTNTDQGGNVTISLRYKPRTGAAREVYYKYNLKLEGGKISLQYVEPYNAGAATLIENYPECKQLLDAMAGSFSMDNPNDIKLVINSMKFVGTNGHSFVMTAKYPSNASSQQ